MQPIAGILAGTKREFVGVEDNDFATSGQIDQPILLELGKLAADGFDREPEHIGNLLA